MAKAVIIGTGVIGSAIACEMARGGWDVVSVDRNTQVGHGSTAGSCAIIRMHYSTLEGTAFAWEGYHYWRDWEDYLALPAGTDLAQFRECGCLVMKTGENSQLSHHIENSEKLGIPFEVWGASEILERLPYYQLDRFAPAKARNEDGFGAPTGGQIESAVFWPNGGYMSDPALSAQNLAMAAEAAGATRRMGVEVTEILTSNGRASGVKFANGDEIHADVVINVAGPGSAAINKIAGVLEDMTIATRPLRHEVAHVPAPAGVNFEADGMIISDSDISEYCRPEVGNKIVIGSEDPACDPHQWVENDTDYDRNFSDQWTTQVMRYAQRVPSLGIPNTASGIVDLYDAATDWIPIYDKSLLPGFYMACGSSGNQYKNAVIAGRAMAELVNYCEAGNDHDTKPLHYKLPYTGFDLDMGFFSRKRPVNESSSFSVLG